jgi:outer membrane protein assembly factor BamB
MPICNSRRDFVRIALFLIAGVAFTSSVAISDEPNWPAWRGPLGTGVAPDAKPPTQWNQNQNVRWKTILPGRGHSTPIAWGERIFLTTAVPIGEKLPPKMSGRPGEHDNLPTDSKYAFLVIALDHQDGSILWEKVVRVAIPVEAGHRTASLASASPITDGHRLYAHFGTQGLYCLDFEGNVIWQKDFGQMHSKHGHGEGASPTLFGNSVVINWDHEEQSFLVALDKESGEERWRRDRQEDTSWSSPIIMEHEGTRQVVVCGTNRVRGYDLETGEVIWECGGMSSNIVATPVYSNGILYVGSSYEKRVLMAIDLRKAQGDLTGSKQVLWVRTRGTPYVPSMLLYEDSLYFLTHYQNILTRVHGPSGADSPGAVRLGSLGNIYGSPVAANGFVYVTDLSGTTEVITHGEIPRTVAVNQLEENVNASLAIVGDTLLIRGEKHLYCIGAPASN